jgi:Uma2 family endonuclease
MFSNDRDPPDGGAPAVSSRPDRWISPEQYLEVERRAEYKSEYLDGRVYALSGASRTHNLIALNLASELSRQLRRRPCEVYASAMRLKVSETGLYTYPDVTVVCGEPRLEDRHADVLLNPTLLVEVLSRSTERHDRGRKAEHYRRIPSLQEYLLVSQTEPHVERYRRHGERDWLLSEVEGLEAAVELDSIGCRLVLAEVYERVL